MLSKFNPLGLGPAPRLEDNCTNAVKAGPTLAVSVSCKILQRLKCLKHSRANPHPSSRSGVNSGGRSFEFSENIRFPTVSNPLPHTTSDAPRKAKHVDRSAPQACLAIGKEGRDPVAAGIHRIPSPSLVFDFSLSHSQPIERRETSLSPCSRGNFASNTRDKTIMIINSLGCLSRCPPLSHVVSTKLPIKKL